MNEDTLLVDIRNLTIRTGNTLILNNAAFSIHQQEHWAIIGKSGSGKTSFAHALCGRQFYNGEINFYYSSAVHKGGVVLIEQQHRFKNLSNTSEFYYQQRFNSSDAENSITVMQALHNYNTSDTTDESLQKWISLLRLTPLLDEPLIQLSNGENKRLQLAEALLSDPAILILDNPFIGLDTEGRQTLYTIIDEITRNNIHIILITTPHELPVCITHIGVLENNSISFFPKEQYYAQAQVKNTAISPPILDREHLREIAKPENAGFSFAVQMRNVSIQYGNKKILNSINWEVRKGDCWSISGPNGAGKSTLLSLINADNPQAYANEIYLFDKRRGQGESIWDIKRRIGYVSPELHLFFEQHNTCFSIIASGLFDTIGLFRQINDEQQRQVELWIKLLKLERWQHHLFFQLSLGQQRVVLLARALVKNPPLLILDEPCQGLDEEQTLYVKKMIDELCHYFGTTLLYVSHYATDIPTGVTNFLKLENGCRVL